MGQVAQEKDEEVPPQGEHWRKAIVVRLSEQEGVNPWGGSQRNGESDNLG